VLFFHAFVFFLFKDFIHIISSPDISMFLFDVKSFFDEIPNVCLKNQGWSLTTSTYHVHNLVCAETLCLHRACERFFYVFTGT
jgi:hypothetical protein